MKFKNLVPSNLRSTRWLEFFDALDSYMSKFKKEKLEILENKFIVEKSEKPNLRDLVERKGYTLFESEGFTSSLEYFRRRADSLPVEILWLLSDKCYRNVLKSFWLFGETFSLELDFDTFYYPKNLISGTNSVDSEYQLLDQEQDVIFYFLNGFPVPNPPIPTFQPALFLDTFEFPNLDLDSQRSGTNHFLIDYGFHVVEDKNVFISKNTSRVLWETITGIHRMKEIPHYRVMLEPKVNTDGSSWLKNYTTYDFDDSKNSTLETIYIKNNFALAKYIEFGTDPYTILSNQISRVNVSLGYIPISGLFDVIRQAVSGLQIEYKITEYGKLNVSGNNIVKFSEVAVLDENFEAIAYMKFPEINFYSKMYTSLKLEIDAQDTN